MRDPLWKPSEDRMKRANMTRFMEHVNQTFGTAFSDYPALYQWSCENIPDFWGAFWDFAGIKASAPWEEVVDDPSKMPGAKWFSGARLNFAEHLLSHRDDRPAIVFTGEGQEPVHTTYGKLYDQVARLARALRGQGVEAGDRVVGFMPNMTEAIIAMLASASIGAIWSSCSPDFGIKGVLDRFGQIEPKVLFMANGYFYNGKAFDSLGRIAEILPGIPSVEKVVVVSYTTDDFDAGGVRDAVRWDDFLAPEPGGEIAFEQVPFEHPLYIMYSSGTTGLPKCLVQSQGGILLHHMKELMLHTDLTRDDVIFYFTTCGWMMWNWLVSSLSLGATVCLFDGSPFHPDPEVLWRLAEAEGITVFGTSARYIAALEKAGARPGRDHDLSKLRAVLSTGSPLAPENFEYVYREIKADCQLSSIAGGTDLNGCFALGNPIGPVYSGELQCRGLAMKVAAYDETASPVYDQKGELVCEAAFPSMPITFWNDPDGQKYHKAYFDVYPGVWRHGDFVEVRSDSGGVVFYGRSDTTLNPGGVRIGTSEIYRVVETLDEVADSMVVGQNWDGDVRVLLFVKLSEGMELSDDLVRRIRTAIRMGTSPRHVPAKVLTIGDIPYTISGKKVEMAVRSVIHGETVKNRDALANPEALDLYKDLPELEA